MLLENFKRIPRGFKYKQPYPQGWGSLTGQPHLGLDLMTPVGTPLFAHFDGKITNSVGVEGGNTVILSNSRYSVRCLHLSKFVNPGNVKKGAIIGYTGGAKGEEGSGTSSGPHVHVDCWNGKVNIKDFSQTIDPDDFFTELKVLVIGDKEYDFKDLIADNPYINLTQKIVNLTPKWITNGKGERIIDPVWADFNLATYGYDIISFVTKNYERANTIGYTPEEPRLGSYRCFVRDSEDKRGTVPGWRRDNQIAGTLEHEIYHALYHGCTLTDLTHELDKGLGFPFLPLQKFKGWDIPDSIRLFKRKQKEILYREVKKTLYSLYPGLWKKFGYIETI